MLWEAMKVFGKKLEILEIFDWKVTSPGWTKPGHFQQFYPYLLNISNGAGE